MRLEDVLCGKVDPKRHRVLVEIPDSDDDPFETYKDLLTIDDWPLERAIGN